jgi:hypothetical protein
MHSFLAIPIAIALSTPPALAGGKESGGAHGGACITPTGQHCKVGYGAPSYAPNVMWGCNMVSRTEFLNPEYDAKECDNRAPGPLRARLTSKKCVRPELLKSGSEWSIWRNGEGISVRVYAADGLSVVPNTAPQFERAPDVLPATSPFVGVDFARRYGGAHLFPHEAIIIDFRKGECIFGEYVDDAARGASHAAILCRNFKSIEEIGNNPSPVPVDAKPTGLGAHMPRKPLPMDSVEVAVHINHPVLGTVVNLMTNMKTGDHGSHLMRRSFRYTRATCAPGEPLGYRPGAEPVLLNNFMTQ